MNSNSKIQQQRGNLIALIVSLILIGIIIIFMIMR